MLPSGGGHGGHLVVLMSNVKMVGGNVQCQNGGGGNVQGQHGGRGDDVQGHHGGGCGGGDVQGQHGDNRHDGRGERCSYFGTKTLE